MKKIGLLILISTFWFFYSYKPILFSKKKSTAIDSIFMYSKTFPINGYNCSWKIDTLDFPIFYLLDNSTKRILLEAPVDFNVYGNYAVNMDSIDNFNSYVFKDLNFDGFLDFNIYSKGSMPMTSSTNIYIFNNKKKIFEYSEELTDVSIDSINQRKRFLITSSFTFSSTTQKKHHFTNKGKLKYTEIITEEKINESDSSNYINIIYEKKILDKIIKRERKIEKLNN